MSNLLQPSRNRNSMILTANLVFLFAIFFITRDLSLQLLDIVTVGLAIVSLLLLAYQTFLPPAPSLGRFIDVAQTLIAGIIALRFLVLFIGDLAALASLFLYGAIILFFFVAVSGAWALIRESGFMPNASNASPTPVDAETSTADAATPTS